MTIKMKETTYSGPTNQILAIPDHYVAIGYKHAKYSAQVPGNAVAVGTTYVVKAGTIYPANDETAKGIVANDYDVTDGDKNMAVIIHGFIKTSALPEEPTDAAKLALSQISFLPIEPVGNADVLAKLDETDGSLTYDGELVDAPASTS